MSNHTAILWNVERLFRSTTSVVARTLGATARDGWTLALYRRKVRAIADALLAACPDGPPVLLALVEVESAAVVRDIIRATGWTDLVDAAVPDEDLGGYDLALAYSAKVFALDGEPRSFNIQSRFSTRDILDVPLRTRIGGHRLRVVHNHWPSRKITDASALRLSAADHCSRLLESHLKLEADELLAPEHITLPARTVLTERWDTPILVMGDFNDSPFDASLGWLLGSTRDPDTLLRAPRFPARRGKKAVHNYLALQPRLYNPSWRLLTERPRPGTKALATTYYAGEWLLLDQVLCSRGLLLPGPGVRFVDGSLRIFGPRHVGRGAAQRSMTTAGGVPSAFQRDGSVGISDHLPLLWELAIG